MLQRNDIEYEVEGVVEEDEQLCSRLNRAMSEKYGFADRIWGLIRRADAVAIRIRARVAEMPIALGDPPDSDATPARVDPP